MTESLRFGLSRWQWWNLMLGLMGDVNEQMCAKPLTVLAHGKHLILGCLLIMRIVSVTWSCVLWKQCIDRPLSHFSLDVWWWKWGSLKILSPVLFCFVPTLPTLFGPSASFFLSSSFQHNSSSWHNGMQQFWGGCECWEGVLCEVRERLILRAQGEDGCVCVSGDGVWWDY